MIVSVDTTNLFQAATIHSISWQESHRDFCTPDFVAAHTPDRQRDYLSKKMNSGTLLHCGFLRIISMLRDSIREWVL